MTESETAGPRYHVVGYILASIIVGVVGLLTAIVLTVTGTLNNFSEVSASYDDVFESGTEIGPIATTLELDKANYVLVSFSDTTEQPSQAEQSSACTVTNEYGERVILETSTQAVDESDAQAAPYDLSDVNHVIFSNFESVGGSYVVSCEQFGLLSDGSDYAMGSTAINGILIGVISVIVAGALFWRGIYNSSRNRKAQRRQPRHVMDTGVGRS